MTTPDSFKNKSSRPWWTSATIYEVYVRSFKDSNEDGIGDLRGLISRLDYLHWLGVEAVWLSPIYESPLIDVGYDVRDHKAIAPELGTFSDFDSLVQALHGRKMRLILDLVLNHTSAHHPWFVASQQGTSSRYRDWYIWKDGRGPGGESPPNNWRSVVGGSAWNHHKASGQWYLASFLPSQPDLNYRNPEVLGASMRIVDFWLDRNVDGFRLDLFSFLFKEPTFKNAAWDSALPSLDPTSKRFRRLFKHTLNRPETIEFSHRLRNQVTRSGREVFLVGEVFGGVETCGEYCKPEKFGLSSVFYFETQRAKQSCESYRKLIEDAEQKAPSRALLSWVFSNHDIYRRISKFDGDIERAKLDAAFLLTIRGIPIIYYGEEVGVQQHRIGLENARDGLTHKYSWVPGWAHRLVWRWFRQSLNRDECRTPMQWDSSENAGFCDASTQPWLPVHPRYVALNVEAESRTGDSLLMCYRRFLQVRKENPALSSGCLTLLQGGLEAHQILGFRRTAKLCEGGQELDVFLNFSTGPTRLAVEGTRVLAATNQFGTTLEGCQLQLPGIAAAVVERASNKGEAFDGNRQ